MGSTFFISKKLKNELEKDLKKRNYIEDTIDSLHDQLNKQNDKIKKDMNKFYDEIDDITVLSTFEYIEQHGTKKQKEALEQIEERYQNSCLLIEDTLNLIDWYEKMCEFYKNNDFEG